MERPDLLAVRLLGFVLCVGVSAPQVVRAEEAETQEEEPAPVVAGWQEDEGGFVVMSADKSFKLQLGFIGGYKAEPIRVEDEWQNRRAFFVLRPYFAGNLYKPWIKFYTSMELAANPPFLLESFVDVAPWPQLGLRLGQFGTPFSRHESFGPNQLLFPDWAVTANYFWSGHDKGVAVYGAVADEKLGWWAGAFGGSPIRRFTTVAGNFVVQARLTFTPVGPVPRTEFPYIVEQGEEGAPFALSFNANAWYGKVQLAEGNFNPGMFTITEVPTGETNRNVTAGADVFLQCRWLVVFGEGYWRRTNPEVGADYDSWGAWGELGVLLVPRTLDVGVRVNYVDPSTDLDEDTFRSVEAQLGWYVWSNHLMLKLRYGLAEQRSPGEAALGPVLLPIAAVGTVQLFTLQGMIAF